MVSLPGDLYLNLIGKPYAADGRGPEAFDCLGLVLEMLRRVGHPVPAYRSTLEELAAQQRDGMLGPLREVQHADGGVVVLVRSVRHRDERHLGFMVDRFRMLHASAHFGAVVLEPLLRSAFAHRVLGFYVSEVQL